MDMRTPKTAAYLAAVFCLLLAYGPSEALAQVVGAVTRVQKQAQIGSVAAAEGTPVRMNDVIRTGPAARLQITFSDETQLTLGENARVVIDRFVFDPNASVGVLSLDAAQGALRFATGKLGAMRNKDVTITTPQAALAVRGTDCMQGFVPGYYVWGVYCFEGTVLASDSVNRVTVPAGYGADRLPTAGLEGPSKWPQEKIAALLSTISFGLALGPKEIITITGGLAAAAAAIAVSQDDDEDKPASP